MFDILACPVRACMFERVEFLDVDVKKNLPSLKVVAMITKNGLRGGANQS